MMPCAASDDSRASRRPRRFVSHSWTLAFVLTKSARGVLDPGDVLFTSQDFAQRRTVFVKPGDRLLLVSEWPSSGPRRRALPEILRQDVVPDSQLGDFSLEWLPNTTLYAVRPRDLFVPGLADIDWRFAAEINEHILEALAATGEDVRRHALGIFGLIGSGFSDSCADDDRFRKVLARKMRAVLSVLAGDAKLLTWVATHMLEDSQMLGDEMILEGSYKDQIVLRLSVWSDYARLLGLKWDAGAHEHGPSVVASVQLSGNLLHHVWRRDAKTLASFEFSPYLHRSGSRAGEVPWEERAALQQSPMKGEALHLEEGMAYMFPPRWIHAVRPPPSGVALSLELQVRPRMGYACGATHPLLVRTPPRDPPPILQHWFEEHRGALRGHVLAFLARNMQGALDLDMNQSRPFGGPKVQPEESPAEAEERLRELRERERARAYQDHLEQLGRQRIREKRERLREQYERKVAKASTRPEL